MTARSYVNNFARVAFSLALSAVGVGSIEGCASQDHMVLADASATGISVSGTGEAMGRPDIGHIQIGFEARFATAEQASDTASSQMTAVVAALKALGVADKDIRTNRISLDREFQPAPPTPIAVAPTAPVAPPKGGRPMAPVAPTAVVVAPPTPQGYEVFRASGSVEVTLRDLDKAGLVIQAATKAGANDVGNFEMTVEDQKPLEKQARDKAVADARSRAEQLAKLAGVTLGPVVAIQEEGSGGSYAPRMAMFAPKAAGEAMPIERGDVKVTRQVNLRFSIAR